MRYPDNGGLTAQERQRRERLRLHAADRLAVLEAELETGPAAYEIQVTLADRKHGRRQGLPDAGAREHQQDHYSRCLYGSRGSTAHPGGGDVG
ncbi:hypothetical protein [Planotetraspora sp. GP83]|uniref:hypothetical protein n=1 Tax=Planotetraspora sp. GP83 TaxID=3156264 RepID=UPI00351187B4